MKHVFWLLLGLLPVLLISGCSSQAELNALVESVSIDIEGVSPESRVDLYNPRKYDSASIEWCLENDCNSNVPYTGEGVYRWPWISVNIVYYPDAGTAAATEDFMLTDYFSKIITSRMMTKTISGQEIYYFDYDVGPFSDEIRAKGKMYFWRKDNKLISIKVVRNAPQPSLDTLANLLVSALDQE